MLAHCRLTFRPCVYVDIIKSYLYIDNSVLHPDGLWTGIHVLMSSEIQEIDSILLIQVADHDFILFVIEVELH